MTLETILCGGRRFTSSEALQRFADQVTAAADGRTTDITLVTNRDRQMQVRRAERKAEQAGI